MLALWRCCVRVADLCGICMGIERDFVEEVAVFLKERLVRSE